MQEYFEEYRLVYGDELSDLNEKVTGLLREDWQLYGNPFCREVHPHGFVQAMVKPKKRVSEPDRAPVNPAMAHRLL